MNDLTIFNHNGINVVDSREVAEMVEKRHDHLVRDVDTYVGYIENLAEQSTKMGNGLTIRVSDFFFPGEYESGNPPRKYRCYLLTRKGCDMVANKMTGEKGVLFTAAYVTKFEEMEKALTQPKIPQTYAEALRELAATWEENQKLLPKAQYFDALVERNLLTNFRDTAKELKVKERIFIDWLLDNGYVYRDPKGKLKAYSQHVPSLFEYKEQTGDNWIGLQTLITPKGRETFRLLLSRSLTPTKAR